MLRVGSHKSHEANELPAEAPLANVLESNPESRWGERERMTLIDRVQKWREEGRRQSLEKGIEQGRREGFERGRREGIELGIQEGVERGRMAGERELVSWLVARRIGAAAAVHFVPVLNRLSEEERVRAITQLPTHNKFADIRDLDAVDSAEELEELAESVAEWVAQTDASELVDRFRKWVHLVVAPHLYFARGTREPGILGEPAAPILTVFEQSRQLDEEIDEQWFNEGLERGRRWGVEDGWRKGIEAGMQQGLEQGWTEVERRLVEGLIAEKFDPGDAETLAPVLGSPSAPDRMLVIGDVVLDCGTAEEVVARMGDG